MIFALFAIYFLNQDNAHSKKFSPTVIPMFQLKDYQYSLPEELIAKEPLASRSASRLMMLDPVDQTIAHQSFQSLVDDLQEGDLVVFNDTRVMKARFFAQKPTGGQVEILIERVIDEQNALVHLKANRSVSIGTSLYLCADPSIRCTVSHRFDFLFHITLDAGSFWQVMESHGQLPLPPYMKRLAEEKDSERYQTHFASALGSVAAPTAALHFDQAILQRLAEKKVETATVTLHIGAGTFKPVKCEDVRLHTMHREQFRMSAEAALQINTAKDNGRRVIAVGTTALRVLESIEGRYSETCGETNIFIYPGYRFKTVNALLTNFHLPGSTLLMLVCAFAGYEFTLEAYRQAVQQSYRFFSYGDAMFIRQSAQRD